MEVTMMIKTSQTCQADTGQDLQLTLFISDKCDFSDFDCGMFEIFQKLMIWDFHTQKSLQSLVITQNSEKKASFEQTEFSGKPDLLEVIRSLQYFKQLLFTFMVSRKTPQNVPLLSKEGKNIYIYKVKIYKYFYMFHGSKWDLNAYLPQF